MSTFDRTYIYGYINMVWHLINLIAKSDFIYNYFCRTKTHTFIDFT